MTNGPDAQARLRATFEAVSDEEVIKGALAEAVEVLHEVAASHGPSLSLRARAQSAARQLDAVGDGLFAEFREEVLAQIARLRYPASFEREDPEADEARRYLIGPEGLRHAVGGSRGTLCGLPADAVEVLRSMFVADRIDSCPTCSELVQG